MAAGTATPISAWCMVERKLTPTPRERWETHALRLAESLRSRLACELGTYTWNHNRDLWEAS